jgi:hypothetical protein
VQTLVASHRLTERKEMAASENRKGIIRAAWEERGKSQWDQKTHGRGLLSLHIPASVEMTAARFGAPLPAYDDLEFRLVRATMNGQPVNSIVCEDVVVETVEDPSPPSTGWMNSSDEAANEIAQTAGANRGRSMADISSGPISVAPPQGQPSQGLGTAGSVRAGAQGRATLSITFADNEAVTGWLNGQSDDVAVVFAARAALRVLPAITFSPWPSTGRKTTREIVLRVFRAVATAWAVAAYPGHRRELNDAARAALSGLGDVKAPSPIRAAVYASATASGEAGTASRASTVIGYALDAAGSKGSEAFQSLLDVLATDASFLSDRFSPVTLANSKLWPGNVPDWVRNSWGELRFGLRDADEDWETWINWYEERLAGDTTSQDIEIARVTIDGNIWKQELKTVNAHIRELLEERGIFLNALANEPENPPEADAIPRQTAAASQFAIDAEGRLDLLPDAPVHDDMQREIYQEVRYKALALSGLGYAVLDGLDRAHRRCFNHPALVPRQHFAATAQGARHSGNVGRPY